MEESNEIPIYHDLIHKKFLELETLAHEKNLGFLIDGYVDVENSISTTVDMWSEMAIQEITENFKDKDNESKELTKKELQDKINQDISENKLFMMDAKYAGLYSSVGRKEKSMVKQGDSCGDQAHRLALITVGADAEKIKVPIRDNFETFKKELNEKKDCIVRINIEEIDRKYTCFEHAYVAICIDKKIAIYQSFMGKFDTFQWLNDDKSKNFIAKEKYISLLEDILSKDESKRTASYGELHNLTNGDQSIVPSLKLKYEITDFDSKKAIILLEKTTDEIKGILEKNPKMSEEISQRYWKSIENSVGIDLCNEIKNGVSQYNMDPVVQSMESTLNF